MMLSLIHILYTVLYEGTEPKTALNALFTRSIKEEFYQ